jgi:hypothetical protein
LCGRWMTNLVTVEMIDVAAEDGVSADRNTDVGDGSVELGLLALTCESTGRSADGIRRMDRLTHRK